VTRLGIVGGGQLGRMMTGPAHQLGYEVTVLDPAEGGPAAQVTNQQIVAGFDDDAAIRELASQSDFLTFEIESAGEAVLQELATSMPVNPSPDTLFLIKDKLRQKEYFERHGIPTGPFRRVSSSDEARAAGEQFGYPFLLKARVGGYDGRGNEVIGGPDDIIAALDRLGDVVYAEAFVAFERELAVMVARDVTGTIVNYPVTQTVHERNICQATVTPAPVNDQVARAAVESARRVAERLGGGGVFGIEMFLVGDNVLVNEVAPRVHNSGHYTIEACYVSQFEQHVRAVTGMPLGTTDLRVPAAAMVNILGEREGPAEPEGLTEALATPGVAVHLYGKAETRVDRKMGHVTAVGASVDEALNLAKTARAQSRI
jgi:5-(carboxyamino)imidazole ribonucleotide synthase